MKTYWRTAADPPGLLLTARHEASDPARPPFRTERADPNHGVVSIAVQPRLWIGESVYGGESHDVVRDPRWAMTPPGVVPAITTPIIRSLTGGAADPTESVVAWAKWFARSLAASRASPLHAGEWQIRRLGVLRKAPRNDESCPAATSDWFSFTKVVTYASRPRESIRTRDAFSLPWAGWELLPIRRLSGADIGRVKALRKEARSGTLPPILVIAHTVLGAFPILDGHVRLEAALEEGVEPAVLGLFPMHEVRGKTPRERSAVAALESLLAQTDRRSASYESINRAYAAQFDNRPTLHVRSRMYAMRGGVPAWQRLAGPSVARDVAALGQGP